MSTKNWRTEQQNVVTEALSDVEGLMSIKTNRIYRTADTVAMQTHCVYRTTDDAAMQAAQLVLREQKFWLAEVQMVEGMFYSLKYQSPARYGVMEVVLQFDTQSAYRNVPLQLCYRRFDHPHKAPEIKAWQPGDFTYGTKTSKAEKLEKEFWEYRRSRQANISLPFWVPLFG